MPLETLPIVGPTVPVAGLVRRPAFPRRARSMTRHPSVGWRPLQRLFWVMFVGLSAAVLSKAGTHPLESLLGAECIIVSAMLPSYFWIYAKVRGLPLFPAYALTCVWTFGLPLLDEASIVVAFSGWYHLVAALSISGFLLLGTLFWYAVASRPPKPPKVCWTMNETLSVPILMAALGSCALWTMVYNAGCVHLSSGLDSLSRAFLLAVQSLSCFVISYRLGSGKLTPSFTALFFVSLAILIMAILPTLLLIYAMSMAAIALLAYVVASKRLPWLVCILLLVVFGFLHLGKSKMREKYWDEGNEGMRSVSPIHYPSFYFDWVASSLEAIRENDTGEEASASLLERASLMHLLLYFQAATPSTIPYLHGETYAMIPRMLVPRMLDPNKPRSNEASYILAIHYNMQTREDTETTTFAFGLINEAYANFGFLGMGGLAILLGLFYGQVGYWTRQMPILSFRTLFAVLVASYSFQAEYTSTFYVAALFQSTVVLLVAALVTMRRQPRLTAQVSLLN